MIDSRRTFLKQISAISLGSGLGSWSFAESPNTPLLPRSTPEAEGVESADIEAFVEAILHNKIELHSFMILRHGKVIAESWAKPYGPQINHTMYSMSKSFTSTAIGLLAAEGRLSVEDLVVRFFPQDVPEPASENLASLKVKHLLTMSVGSEHEPTQAMVKTDHWVRTFLEHSISHTPGTVFMYNSAATYMLSAIVTKITGQTVLDFLTPKLFKPLGIDGMKWETCPRGINTGGWGLSIPTEGLAKFGQLYLQKGKWNGEQLIPSKWVNEATTFKIQQPVADKPGRPKEQNDWMQGYCYQFWRCQHDGFRGDGAFGQFTIVLPKQDAVIVMTSETNNMPGQLDLVWQHLLPAFKPKALPPVEPVLRLRLKKIDLVPPQGLGRGTPIALIMDKTYTLEANELGFTSVDFKNVKGTWLFNVKAGETSHTIMCGENDWHHGETLMPGTPPRLISGGTPKIPVPTKVAAAAAWKDEHTLQMVWRYYETPHHDTVTCKFEGDQVTISFLSSIAAMSGKTKDSRPDLTGKIQA